MRVLITGVSGFVGCRLARHLAARSHRVSGTYLGSSPELPGVKLCEADLLEPEELERAVEGCDPEAVVHLAGLSHVGESWQKMGQYFRVNVTGTENLLRVVSPRRLVVASSAEVYGNVPEAEQPISEERTLDPCTPYALTKAATERIAAAHGAIRVRSFNLVGSGQAPRFALPGFAAQLAEIAAGRQEPVLRVGNLEARRDFLHVEDAVDAYRILLERGEEGVAYNLGSGTARSLRGALETLIEISGVAVEVRVERERLRPADVPLLQADISRLRLLGFAPRRSLEEAAEEIWVEAAERGGIPPGRR